MCFQFHLPLKYFSHFSLDCFHSEVLPLCLSIHFQILFKRLWGRCFKMYSCLGNIPHSTSPNCFFPPGAISASDLKKVSSSWDPKLFILYALGPENTYTLTNLLSIPLASLSLVSMCCYWKILSVWPPIQPSHPKMSLQPLQKYLKIADIWVSLVLWHQYAFISFTLWLFTAFSGT